LTVSLICHGISCFFKRNSLDKKNSAQKYDSFIDEESQIKNSNKVSLLKSLYFAFPAVLYCINNNLGNKIFQFYKNKFCFLKSFVISTVAIYIQLYMDSTSYQMLSNLKIFSTAILYYFIMGKSLNKKKWFALSLLFVAGIFYSIANLKSIKNYYITLDENDLNSIVNNRRANLVKEYSNLQDMKLISSTPSSSVSSKFRIRDQIYITEIGLILMIIYSLISGLSGCLNEKLLKLNFSDSIYVQNIYLYLYGCLFNFLAHICEIYFNEVPGLSKKYYFEDFLSGFNGLTWIIVFTQVFNGLTMSIVMKYQNNITRLFVISSSLVVTVLMSVFLFSLKLNIYFYFCFCTILIALYSYIF